MVSKIISAPDIWSWLKLPGDAWRPCAKWRLASSILAVVPSPMSLDDFLALDSFDDNEKLWALLRPEFISLNVLDELANELMARTDRVMLTAWPESNKQDERAQAVRETIDKVVDECGQVRAYAITFMVGTHVDENEYPFYMQRLREILSGD